MGVRSEITQRVYAGFKSQKKEIYITKQATSAQQTSAHPGFESKIS
jgi:hypothetical protein